MKEDIIISIRSQLCRTILGRHVASPINVHQWSTANGWLEIIEWSGMIGVTSQSLGKWSVWVCAAFPDDTFNNSTQLLVDLLCTIKKSTIQVQTVGAVANAEREHMFGNFGCTIDWFACESIASSIAATGARVCWYNDLCLLGHRNYVNCICHTIVPTSIVVVATLLHIDIQLHSKWLVLKLILINAARLLLCSLRMPWQPNIEPGPKVTVPNWQVNQYTNNTAYSYI